MIIAKSGFRDVNQVQVDTIRLLLKDSNHNFFVDAITISSYKLTNDVDGG